VLDKAINGTIRKIVQNGRCLICPAFYLVFCNVMDDVLKKYTKVIMIIIKEAKRNIVSAV
jgi:hypothetical protein